MNSKYFSIGEWKCRDGTPYPVEWIDDRWGPLSALCDKIRERWGSPLIVVSGYRTPAHNVAVGGAQQSQHMEGRAADLRPTSGNAVDLHKLVLVMYHNGELSNLGGLGSYPGWVHVDIREGGDHLAQWSGGGGVERA